VLQVFALLGVLFGEGVRARNIEQVTCINEKSTHGIMASARIRCCRLFERFSEIMGIDDSRIRQLPL